MQTVLYADIVFFGLASYVVGCTEMLKGKYSPSVFSRIVWVLLSINSFAGVYFSGGSHSSLILSFIFLIGNVAICLISFWKGTREFGYTEYVCAALLVISGLIWFYFSAPLLNLIISLVAHFIGGIPTYKKVWNNPKSESVGFWSLFFIASLLSLIASDTKELSRIAFPLYFTFFDGSMFLLSVRKNPKNRAV